MAWRRYRVQFERLDKATLAAWRKIPPSVASDVMNRSRSMSGAIQPIGAGMRLVGQARTVEAMVGDNSIIHIAVALAENGEVIVADAGGSLEVAVWGEIMTCAARARGIAGVVLDGATRDKAEIIAMKFPVFARGTVPSGPHKGFGGTIDGAVAVGGVVVRPGDLVLGDDNGVVVVPLGDAATVLKEARAHLAKEVGWRKAIAAGRSMPAVMGLPEPEIVEG